MGGDVYDLIIPLEILRGPSERNSVYPQDPTMKQVIYLDYFLIVSVPS